jgi:phosphoenolpyruvate carboxylase
LKEVRKIVKRDHHSLYLSEITSLINKIQLFGHHFATLDIRQDSRIHHSVFSKIVEKSKEANNKIFPDNYNELSEDEQINVLSELDAVLDTSIFEDELVKNTLQTIKVVKEIQNSNGEKGAHRYIISNNQTA